MKKKLFTKALALLLVFTCVMMFAPATSRNVHAAPPKILLSNGKSVPSMLFKGESFSLKCTKTTKAQKARFYSSNKAVATVSGNGRLKVKGTGKVTITVKDKKGKKIASTRFTACAVSFKSHSLLFSKKGGRYKLGCTDLNGSDYLLEKNGSFSDSYFKWESSNAKVAKVSAHGELNLKHYGTTVITIKSTFSGKKLDSITVNNTELKSVAFAKDALTFIVEGIDEETSDDGDDVIDDGDDDSDDTTDDSSDDSDDEDDSDDGEDTDDGEDGGDEVEDIEDPTRTISLGDTDRDDIAYELKITPNKVFNAKHFNWKISDESIATIGKDGTIHVLKYGTVTVTAAFKNNTEIKASVKLTFVMPDETDDTDSDEGEDDDTDDSTDDGE